MQAKQTKFLPIPSNLFYTNDRTSSPPTRPSHEWATLARRSALEPCLGRLQRRALVERREELALADVDRVAHLGGGATSYVFRNEVMPLHVVSEHILEIRMLQTNNTRSASFSLSLEIKKAIHPDG